MRHASSLLSTTQGGDRPTDAREPQMKGSDRSIERCATFAARDGAALGELRDWTPTIQALCVPDVDASLDEQPAKTAFWNAFKALGPWWAELPPY